VNMTGVIARQDITCAFHRRRGVGPAVRERGFRSVVVIDTICHRLQRSPEAADHPSAEGPP